MTKGDCSLQNVPTLWWMKQLVHGHSDTQAAACQGDLAQRVISWYSIHLHLAKHTSILRHAGVNASSNQQNSLIHARRLEKPAPDPQPVGSPAVLTKGRKKCFPSQGFHATPPASLSCMPSRRLEDDVSQPSPALLAGAVDHFLPCSWLHPVDTKWLGHVSVLLLKDFGKMETCWKLTGSWHCSQGSNIFSQFGCEEGGTDKLLES
eukprot:scaffold128072_cov18-Tisochrysis_lutea.AAC.2